MPSVGLQPSAPQHSAEDKHGAPSALQVLVVHVPLTQELPQQSSLVVHEKPSGWQMVSLQTPLAKQCFVQHSSSSVHAFPGSKQAVPPQEPLVHVSLQQSTELVQAAPVTPQQAWRTQTARPPEKPQHCSSVEQVSRAALQTGGTSRHRQAASQLVKQPASEKCLR